jgi:hypothetical protein
MYVGFAIMTWSTSQTTAHYQHLREVCMNCDVRGVQTLHADLICALLQDLTRQLLLLAVTYQRARGAVGYTAILPEAL